MQPREVIKMWHANHTLHRDRTLPQNIHTPLCLTSTKQPNNYLSLKSCTHEMTLWKVWEFQYLLYLNVNGWEQRFSIGCQQWWRCWMNGHKQWFSNGYREQTWNNDDVGWTVTNSGSAMGIGNRRETMATEERSQTVVQQLGVSNKSETTAMLDERSQTAVQHWVSATRVKQRRCWMNGHKQWFSIGCQ